MNKHLENTQKSLAHFGDDESGLFSCFQAVRSTEHSVGDLKRNQHGL